MLLVSDFVGFQQPLEHFLVQIVDRSNMKVVYKSARAEFFDPVAAGMFEGPGQDHMAAHPTRIQ